MCYLPLPVVEQALECTTRGIDAKSRASCSMNCRWADMRTLCSQNMQAHMNAAATSILHDLTCSACSKTADCKFCCATDCNCQCTCASKSGAVHCTVQQLQLHSTIMCEQGLTDSQPISSLPPAQFTTTVNRSQASRQACLLKGPSTLAHLFVYVMMHTEHCLQQVFGHLLWPCSCFSLCKITTDTWQVWCRHLGAAWGAFDYVAGSTRLVCSMYCGRSARCRKPESTFRNWSNCTG